MPTDKSLDKLKINVLTIDQYNNQATTSQNELYVVNETSDLDDPGNIISSKTYADRGREAVVTQNDEPTSQYTQIWIDPNEEVVYISPASADMDNISETGSENIVDALTPDFTKITYYSETAAQSFTLAKTGWLYVIWGAGSAIELKKDNSSGLDLVGCVSSSDNKGSNHLLLKKGTKIYVNRRSGTVSIAFIPCKGL